MECHSAHPLDPPAVCKKINSEIASQKISSNAAVYFYLIYHDFPQGFWCDSFDGSFDFKTGQGHYTKLLDTCSLKYEYALFPICHVTTTNANVFQWRFM